SPKKLRMEIRAFRPTSSKSPRGSSIADQLILEKHQEYARGSKINRTLYYAVRVTGGLAAGVIPFVLQSQPVIATALSLTVVITTVIDSVFNPKDRWRVLSRAADLLAIERLKAAGEYERCAAQLEILSATENAKLEQLVNLDELMRKAK